MLGQATGSNIDAVPDPHDQFGSQTLAATSSTLGCSVNTGWLSTLPPITCYLDSSGLPQEGTQPLLAAPITPPKTFSIAAKPSEGPQRKGGKKNSSAAGLHRSVSDAGPCAAKLQVC